MHALRQLWKKVKTKAQLVTYDWDMPRIVNENGREVIAHKGKYDLWYRGNLKKPDMHEKSALAWLKK